MNVHLYTASKFNFTPSHQFMEMLSGSGYKYELCCAAVKKQQTPDGTSAEAYKCEFL